MDDSLEPYEDEAIDLNDDGDQANDETDEEITPVIPAKRIDINFQLNQLKRFLIFGCETNYRSATKRSINRWFLTETNIRLFTQECKIKCIRNFADLLVNQQGNDEKEIAAKQEEIRGKIAKTFVETLDEAAVGVIPFVLSRMTKYPPLRPIVARLIGQVIKGSFDLLLFCHYAKSIKGSPGVVRRGLIDWFHEHSTKPEYIKDLLLVKRRLAWSHKNVLLYWKIPLKDEDVVLKILAGQKYDLNKIENEEIRKIVEMCLQLRNLSNRSLYLDLVKRKDYQETFGYTLVVNIKNQLANVETCLLMIQRLPDNLVIENIPKLLRRFYSSQKIVDALVERIKAFEKPPKVNILSLFIVMKWLEYQDHNKLHDTKKLPFKPISSLLESILNDDSFKYSDSPVAFVLGIPETDTEPEPTNSATIVPKKLTTQEINRPALCPNVIKPIDFVTLLLHLYPNHRIVYQSKYYKLTGGKYQDVKSQLDRIRKNQAKVVLSSQIKNAIYITYDGKIDAGDVADHLMKNLRVERMIILSVQNKQVNITRGPAQLKNIFTIQGLDMNFLSLIEKYFATF